MWGAIGAMSALAGALAEPGAIRDAVVVVQQAGATCAGVALDETADGRRLVATAYHCVAAGWGVSVTTRVGQVGRGRVVARDPRHDLALIDVSRLGPLVTRPVRQGMAPSVGSPVTLVGHPFASSPPGGFLSGTLRWSMSEARVSAVGVHSLQLDATVHPGHSGGPVLDESGHVAGITSRKLGAGLTFAARARALRKLIESPRNPGFGGTVALSPAGWLTARPVLGAHLEVTWRERLVVGVQGGVPIRAREVAEQEDTTEATLGLVRAGGRLPLGAAIGFAIDGFVAVGLTAGYARERPRPTRRIDPFVGAGIGRGGFRFEVARRLTDGPVDHQPWLFGLRFGLGALRRVY